MEKIYKQFLESSGISTDTRTLKQGQIYVALKGANFNGNKYAHQALEQGAKLAIVDEPIEGKNILQVDDSLSFLQQLANYHRKQLNIPFIGITGTNGKTTTKELIAAVLQEQFSVAYTMGNLNNHIGVPLTLLSINATHDIAIIEMGANKPGDIKELAEIAEPTHGIITNIGEAHLEGFGSLQGVVNTKTELYRNIQDSGGTLFYNEDDELLKSLLPSSTKTIAYGVNASTYNYGYDPTSTLATISLNNIKIQSQLTGSYNCYNMMAAAAIGLHFDLSIDQVKAGLENYTPSNNRSQYIQTDLNEVIADMYNANPTSVTTALNSLYKIEHENKLAIIGDMLELGNYSSEKHNDVVVLMNKLNIPFITVGKEFSLIHGANNYLSTDDLLEHLKTNRIQNKYILLKGSRGIQLEKLLEVL